MKRLRDQYGIERIDRFFVISNTFTEMSYDGKPIKRFSIDGVSAQLFKGKTIEVPHDADPIAYIVRELRLFW